MVRVKLAVHELREKTKNELVQELKEMRSTLATLRVAQVSGQSAKNTRVKDVRKNIARVLTVINQTTKQKLRAQYAGQKFVPKELRSKLTRAMRRRLTPEQLAKKTLRQQRMESAYPKRVFAVKASA